MSSQQPVRGHTGAKVATVTGITGATAASEIGAEAFDRHRNAGDHRRAALGARHTEHHPWGPAQVVDVNRLEHADKLARQARTLTRTATGLGAGSVALTAAGVSRLKHAQRTQAAERARKQPAKQAAVAKANSAVTSTLNRMGGAYRGRRSPVQEQQAMSDFVGRTRRAAVPFEVKERASKVAVARLARVARPTGAVRKAEDYGMWVAEQAQRGSGAQPTYGRVGVIGRRIVEPIAKSNRAKAPTGPAKKSPTTARTGGAQPKNSLVTSAAMPTVASAPLMPQLGTLPGSQVVPMRKVDRYFDPEDRRQRRIGAAGAGGVLGGGLLAGSGVRSARRASRSLNGAKKVGDYHAKLPPEQLRGHRGDQKVLMRLATNTERGAVLLNPRAAAKVGGGLALAAGGVKLLTNAGDPRNRRWH